MPSIPAKPLPGLRVQWPQVSPVAGDTFQAYNVKRRDIGGTTWTRIALIQALGTTSYIDYTVQSGKPYEYTVTWTVNRSGNAFESPVITSAQGTITFTGSFVHDATPGGQAAAANYVYLRGNARGLEVVQPSTLVPVWGRARPAMIFGTSRYQTLSYRLVSQDVADLSVWQGLANLQLRQQTLGAPLCVRTGDMADRFFCVITKLTRDDPPYEYLPQIEFGELNVSEAV